MSLKVLRLENHSQTGKQNGTHMRVRWYVVLPQLQCRLEQPTPCQEHGFYAGFFFFILP